MIAFLRISYLRMVWLKLTLVLGLLLFGCALKVLRRLLEYVRTCSQSLEAILL